MKKVAKLTCIALLLTQCQNKIKTEEHAVESETKTEESTTVIPVAEDIEEILTVDSLTDSLNLGVKGSYKLSLKCTRQTDGVYAAFDFYKKVKSEWVHKQNFSIIKDGITGLDAQFKDFNNDGFNDLTFRNGIAARGANELRNLFIFDREKDELIFIKNSGNYPNLQYNAKLDCIDAWLVYGGSTTLFMQIDSDTLREFAGVSLFDTRDVFTVDKAGTTTLISQDIITDSVVYRRYSNYNPLEFE